MIPSSWKVLKYHATQSALWRVRKRFAVVVAGRGSGKSELARRRVVRFLPVKKNWHDPMYFYSLPTRGQAKRVAWEQLKSLVPASWLYKKNAISESDLTIKTEFGSILHLVGMDKPQRIEGNQWDGGVVDESSDQKPGHFTRSIVPALSWRKGWCWRIGVPKRQGPGAAEFKQFYEAAQKEDSDVAAFNWPSSDIIDPELLQWAIENLDEKDFNEQYKANWESNSGNIFHAFGQHNIDEDVIYNPNLNVFVGSDFNVDPMSWVIGHIVSGEMFIFDELFIRNANTQLTLDHLNIKYGTHKAGWEFYGDASGKARKTSATITDYLLIKNDKRFLNKEVHYSKSNPPVRVRFAETNALCKNASGEVRLHIHPRCRNLIADLSSRAYRPGTNEPDDYGDIGHMSDALGYPIHRRFPIRNIIEENSKVYIGK